MRAGADRTLSRYRSSDLTAGSLEMESLCQDIVRILDFFDVRDGALVGHGVGGFIAIQYMLNYPKHAKWRLPHGFVCIACSAGNLQETVGHDSLRQLSKLFAVVRLPEIVSYFDLFGEVSISKRLGANASYAAVRVALEASRAAASEWAMRNLSDMQWNFDLHPHIPALTLPSAVLLSSDDERVPRPTALKDGFEATGSLRAFKLLQDAGHFLPLTSFTDCGNGTLWLDGRGPQHGRHRGRADNAQERSFSAKTPPSPVPEGDEEVSPLHGERLKYLYQTEPCNLEALSGESTDCNCSKTSASSSQGAANLFVVVPSLTLPGVLVICVPLTSLTALLYWHAGMATAKHSAAISLDATSGKSSAARAWLDEGMERRRADHGGFGSLACTIRLRGLRFADSFTPTASGTSTQADAKREMRSLIARGPPSGPRPAIRPAALDLDTMD
eukprot:s10234_g2.t2